MDLQMPEMKGLQATIQIGEEEAMDAHVQIVAMTASAMSEERDRCLAAGMDDCISKPVSYKVIEEMITATVSDRKVVVLSICTEIRGTGCCQSRPRSTWHALRMLIAHGPVPGKTPKTSQAIPPRGGLLRFIRQHYYL
jgi:DNA-binding NarL/FixJ family response regulator